MSFEIKIILQVLFKQQMIGKWKIILHLKTNGKDSHAQFREKDSY